MLKNNKFHKQFIVKKFRVKRWTDFMRQLDRLISGPYQNPKKGQKYNTEILVVKNFLWELSIYKNWQNRKANCQFNILDNYIGN